ncbi:MAG: hypothetical protein KAG66_07730, partial [Methylococcales bacterium]|nr:hypothetical protein [Methylococcales bacterium]
MKKLLLILMTLAVILFAAYVGVGYVIYDSMADISGSTCPASSNLPDNFGSKSSSWRADFDYSAYFMPDYETVSFPSREAGIDIVGWYVAADTAVNADAPSVI